MSSSLMFPFLSFFVLTITCWVAGAAADRSAIIFPEEKQTIIHEGKITLKGWSYSGGGNWVERVEVSGDGGSIWYAVPVENLTQKVCDESSPQSS
jgi:hypothetical protein